MGRGPTLSRPRGSTWHDCCHRRVRPSTSIARKTERPCTTLMHVKIESSCARRHNCSCMSAQGRWRVDVLRVIDEPTAVALASGLDRTGSNDILHTISEVYDIHGDAHLGREGFEQLAAWHADALLRLAVVESW